MQKSFSDGEIFDSNCITPGTEFMQRVDGLLKKYIENRILHEPSWQGLEIYYSGHLVPGEGEHKIIHHIRQKRQHKAYRPNQRHCLVGQDADLIMLGLATHEPHFTILRDVVTFGKPKKIQDSMKQSGGSGGGAEDEEILDVNSLPQSFFMIETPLQLLHLSVLREYLEVEFTHEHQGMPHDRERLIDDFILLTFLVGNDFVPHLPSLDISESAFDLIFDAYKSLHSSSPEQGQGQRGHRYIVENGTIKDYDMLEKLFKTIGRKEEKLMKKRDLFLRSKLKASSVDDSEEDVFVSGMEDSSQDSEVINPEALTSIPAYDNIRERDAKIGESLLLGLRDEDPVSFSREEEEPPPLSDEPPPSVGEDGFVDDSVINLIESSKLLIDTGRVGPTYPGISRKGEKVFGAPGLADPDFSYRDHHYRYKFGIVPSEPSSAPFLQELSRQYLRGLLWCLAYYTSGCVSWGWYFPYHYAPFLSDVRNLKTTIPQIKFELGHPFTPFQQLLGCLPPSSSYLLPKPYQWLMTDPLSPLHHVYPSEFVEDMDGKRHSWEAVVILPFIDSKDIVNAEQLHVPPTALAPAEAQRNTFTKNLIYRATSRGQISRSVVGYHITPSLPFKSELIPGTYIPFFGFPSLRSLPITGISVKVLPSKLNRSYRYKSLILEIFNKFNTSLPLHKLINRTVYIHYPLMQEAMVIGIGTIDSELRHADYLNYETVYGLQASQSSAPLAEDPKIIEFLRTEEEVESWALSSMRQRRAQLLGGIGSSGLAIGKIKTRVIVVPVINRVKDRITGDIQRIYGTVPFDLPAQLVRWSHPASTSEVNLPRGEPNRPSSSASTPKGRIQQRVLSTTAAQSVGGRVPFFRRAGPAGGAGAVGGFLRMMKRLK
jgi:5'-3' exoribonuclease 1